MKVQCKYDRAEILEILDRSDTGFVDFSELTTGERDDTGFCTVEAPPVIIACMMEEFADQGIQLNEAFA